MTTRSAVAPDRRILALIAGTMCLPLAALLYLGWQVTHLDRALEVSQSRERLGARAEQAVAALQRAIVASEQQLARGGDEFGAGAVALTFRPSYVEAAPAGRVAYLPAVKPVSEPDVDAFRAGEALEFRSGNAAAALAAYRALVGSPDPAVRAGGLLRTARIVARSDPERALAINAELAAIDAVTVGGVPAALIGRYRRCELLQQLGRRDELLREAADLQRDLLGGRWAIAPDVHALYAADATRWTGKATLATTHIVLAQAAVKLWDQWREGVRLPARLALDASGTVVTVLWQVDGETGRALLALPSFVEKEWAAPLNRSLAAHGAQLSIVDGVGMTAKTLTGERADALSTRLTAAQAELPWSIVVTGSGLATDARITIRRRLMIAGFALIMAMAVTAAYLTVRAVSRELAVARLQSEFVAAVSHEFRTPLTSLRQFTEMLRQKPDMDQERRQMCVEAQSRAAGRLTRLVESVLDFKRIEAGGGYRLEPHDAADLVRRVVEDFRAEPQAATHTITLTSNAAVPVELDDEAVSRAVWNLLDNAVKYSPDAPEVDVEVGRRNGHVTIAVRDRGLGIPPAEQAAIFSRFHRGSEARRRGIRGTGIGLALVHEIVRAHKGRVDVSSEPGSGTTFTIHLPSAEAG